MRPCEENMWKEKQLFQVGEITTYLYARKNNQAEREISSKWEGIESSGQVEKRLQTGTEKEGRVWWALWVDNDGGILTAAILPETKEAESEMGEEGKRFEDREEGMKDPLG